MDLNKAASEIREILQKKRQEFQLTFEEESHQYTMLGLDGKLTNEWPSVSKVMKLFYDEFPSEQKAFEMAGGNPDEAERILEDWAKKGRLSTSTGSRTHYFLEEHTLKEFGIDKNVRQPIFDCDAEQIIISDTMIVAGKNYIKLLKERGCVLLDTEIVLGDPELGYTGQPDKVWVTMNKSGNEFGLLITDWKTNKPKNFQETNYTERMYKPFEKLPNTALGHYYVQLPLYGKLLLKMLKGSKYENIKLYGCIIAHLRDDTQFEEFRVPKDVIDNVLEMDVKKYLNK
jgi:hypothetical protein